MKTNLKITGVLAFFLAMSSLCFGQVIDKKLQSNDDVKSLQKIIYQVNPAMDVVNLKNLPAQTAIIIYDVNDQIVQVDHTVSAGDKEISVTGLKNGKYYLELSNPLRKVRDVSYFQIKK